MKTALGPRLRFAILAAGFSSRLGRPKALARVGGVSLLSRTLAILAPLTHTRIFIVTPPRTPRMAAVARAFGAHVLENHVRAAGLSSSVRRALRAAHYESAVLLLPVDLVELDRRDVARLIARWRGARRRLTARSLGSKAATPLILPRGLFDRTHGLAGDVGLRDLIARLTQDQLTRVVMPSADPDVDTPQDLARARRQWGRTPIIP